MTGTGPTTVDEIPWEADPPAERLETATPRKCRHPRDRRETVQDALLGSVRRCTRCGHVFDEERRKRGRSARSRGQRLENAANDELGLQRRGRFGGPEDGGGADDPAVAQSKTGPTWYLERFVRELDYLAVPATGRPRILVCSEKPGSGHKARRRLVTMYADEFLVLVGGRLGADAAAAVSDAIDEAASETVG